MTARDIHSLADAVVEIAEKGRGLSVEDVRLLLKRVRTLFQTAAIQAGLDEDQIKKLSAKFRDAGRRSAPWKAFSTTVPGRPQDGADGNRINRWELPEGHKFYADEITATLVEIKFFLHALAMDGAPEIAHERFQRVFVPWLVEHRVVPGDYIEPIQLISVDLPTIIADRRRITSGHIIPLDREGGTHTPENCFLIFGRSNQLQGNMTVPELLTLADELVARHKANGTFPASPEVPSEGLVKGGEAALDA